VDDSGRQTDPRPDFRDQVDANGRPRTPRSNLRKPLLYPLSYEATGKKHLSEAVAELDLMSRREIDTYLESLDEPRRSALQTLRRTILSIIPDAEEGISYGMPAFRLHGKVVAACGQTKGSLHFPIDKPLPKGLVKKLIAVRLKQIRQ
jgi:uncharacterized protein YdhG (YjbR/CyaY superfamily)